MAIRLSGLACIPGGVLWALWPLVMYLSQFLSKIGIPVSETFWRMFPAPVLLLAVGAAGLHARQAKRYGWLGRAGFYVALVGVSLIVAGDVGKYWLHLDSHWIMTAPAYRAFRAGLMALALGSMLFAAASLRARVLPDWGPPPLVIGSLGGLAAFSSDLGYAGAVLWMLFGAGWAWQGFTSLPTRRAVCAWFSARRRFARRSPEPRDRSRPSAAAKGALGKMKDECV